MYVVFEPSASCVFTINKLLITIALMVMKMGVGVCAHVAHMGAPVS